MEEKKKTPNDTIISMICHINADKLDLFHKVSEEYANSLAISNSHRFRILRFVKEKPKRFISLAEMPVDIMKLIRRYDITEDNVFLNEKIKTLIQELMCEWENIDVFKFHNLPVRNKILLHGITGNGKTTIAKHIAKLTKLPFIEINSDLIVDSHVGNSGKNIDRIFNGIKEPCVLFWDEIDTIGRRRGMTNSDSASVENERMTNSVLVNIEKLSNEVIFIGATNRYEVLDTAFLRRFDVKLEIEPPNNEQKEDFLEQMIDYYKMPDRYKQINVSEYISYASIKLMILDLARKYILETLKNKETN